MPVLEKLIQSLLPQLLWFYGTITSRALASLGHSEIGVRPDILTFSSVWGISH